MFIDVQQNTDEWFKLRSGKLTSSSLGLVMANYGKSFGEPAKKLAYKIIGEQVSGCIDNVYYTNEHMIRGHEQEPIARKKYEEDFFCEVLNGGFFQNKFIGGSPDGLIGLEGAIEIKSVIPSVHIENIKRQGMDPKYKWQILGNLKITERAWIDFVSYCHPFPREKQLFVARYYRADPEIQEQFKKIDLRVELFRKFIEQQKDLIMSNNFFVKNNDFEAVHFEQISSFSKYKQETHNVQDRASNKN